MKLRGTKVILFMLVVFLAPFVKAQVSKNDIKELLLVQGINNVDQKASDLFNAYYSSTDTKLQDWGMAAGESAVSGICMGLNQSRTAGYKNTSWMPGFVQDWYQQSFASDVVLSKAFTWQKVWRDMDYATDRMAYEDLKRLFKNDSYKAAAVQFVVKNIAAALIRNEMKSGRLF